VIIASSKLPERMARSCYFRSVCLLPLLLLTGLAARAAPADEIRVAVASNFRPAMTAAAARFEEASGHRIALIPGSTGKHYAQIVNGAPFDAFFAADSRRPQLLESERRIVPGSRFTYAIGTLVLWSPTEGLVDPNGAVLRAATFDHLAIANPELAPYGAAALQVLQALGLWEALASRLVRGENINQAFQFVVSGNAQLGFVARAQLVNPNRIRHGSTWEPPQSLYDPIAQQAVMLRDSPAARAFMSFMRSQEAGALIRRYGYDVPDVQ
jgi:molybdate transport system substrate-binding protein